MSEKVLVTPAELSELVTTEPVVIIDTRDPATYAAGHLPNAVNVHDIFTYLATSTPEGVAAMREKFAGVFGAAGLSGEETAVVYEQSMNTGFGQSCRGYVLLSYLGYPKVKILHGGYAAWTAAGLPTTTEVPTPVAKSFALDPDAMGILVDLQAMKAAVADPNIVKLDTRDVDEWIADSSSPYGKDFCPRKGRIPGAVWIEWYRMMKPTPAGPMFKSSDEILAECASVGVTPKTPVVLYCFKGARASNTLVALKEAGIEDVTLYFGSWNEWSRDPALPIETGLPFKTATASSAAA
jgi:thiosulfate/3-mercaptopyruvate sulfurtransferase